MKMFSIAKNNLTRKAPKGSAGYGNPVGSFKKGDAGVFTVGSPTKNVQQQFESDVSIILHELIHLAAYNGKYFSDKLLSEIINKSSDASIPYSGEFAAYPVNPFDTSKLSKKQKKELENEGALPWGGYWGRVLAAKCFRDKDGKNIDIKGLVDW